MSTSTTEHDAYLVKNWDTETLILYLYDFTQAGLELGPAMRLAKEANALKATTPRRSGYSHRTAV
ncbi:3815_t:CDS:2 [Paraglomus brasilianum]|uniref:3815_t:CDS:1 n=1 Tax=Paraglomus brasilianum TaxID=144538 RepID=A0A9N8WQY9_9GLOM|nr:3815_t:CDS:2 [Paraglomus brasilianum]